MKTKKMICIAANSLLLTPLSSQAAIIINEVSYTGATGTDQVEIMNTGGASVDISSWWICSRFDYRQLNTLTLNSGSLNIAAGQLTVLTIDFDVNNTEADFGLYDAPTFGSTSAMQDFVQWGTSALVGRSNVALAKGIWGESAPGVYDFVATAGAGETVQSQGSGVGVTRFANAVNTIGATNIPEPSSIVLLSIGGLSLVLRRRK